VFHFVGPIEEQDLPAVYSAARALIFPSLHEGFGLPPLEAMACGVPVVAANRTAVPEVVGDAAIMIDPGSSQSLLEALERVNIEHIRRDLIVKGFERVKMFTWDRTVQGITAEVLT
jgi:glycosyltransferase involved in cell wall biosynthesis